MAITKERDITSLETLADGQVWIAERDVFVDGDVRTLAGDKHRRVLAPQHPTSTGWEDVDVSGESTRIQTLTAALWDEDCKTEFRAAWEADRGGTPEEILS